jgi:hypothetical protein
MVDSVILLALVNSFLILVLFVLTYSIYNNMNEIRQDVKEIRRDLKEIKRLQYIMMKDLREIKQHLKINS